MSEIPEANVQATVYEVSCLPFGWKARRHFTMTVEYRGDDRWAVMGGGLCFDADGRVDYEPLASSRTPDFLKRFRFSLEEALAVAKRIAPTLTIGKYTVADALANGAEWR